MGGAGPIPWTAIDRYAERHGIDGERFDELERYIKAIDAAYLEWQSEQHSKAK